MQARAEPVEENDRRRAPRPAVADVNANAGGVDEVVAPLGVSPDEIPCVYFDATLAVVAGAKAG